MLKIDFDDEAKQAFKMLWALPVALLASAYQAFVIAFGWNEFALRVFNLPKVTWVTVFGILLIYSLLKNHKADEGLDGVWGLITKEVLLTTFIWGLLSTLALF